MSVDRQLLAIGKTIISRVNYDLNRKYDVFEAFKALNTKSKQDKAKINKAIR